MPHPDPLVRKLSKASESAVELTRDLQDRLTPETWLLLRSGALGLLWAQSELTSKPNPSEAVDHPMLALDEIKAQVWEEGMAAAKLAAAGIKPARNPYQSKEVSE